MVAAASEEASTNVGAVASAAEEMSASVIEIGRQVHDSSRIAGEAVKQAERTDIRITELLTSSRPDRRRRQADHRDRRADQPAGAQRHHRSRARRRIRPRLCGGRQRGQGAGGADRQGHRRDRDADRRHAGRDTGFGRRDQGDQRRPSRESPISHQTIAATVEEQGAATAEIARNVSEAAKGTAEVAEKIIDVNQRRQRDRRSFGQVLGSARVALRTRAVILKTEVENFLNTVRAA